MAQYNMPTLVPTTDTGTTLCNYLTGGGTGWVAAVNSSHSGTTAPTYNVAGMPFYNTTDKSWGVWNGTDYGMRWKDNARFDGNVAVGRTPYSTVRLHALAEAGNTQTILADTDITGTVAGIESRLGASSTANATGLKITGAGTTGLFDSQYALRVVYNATHTDKFTVKGDGSGYFAGTGQFDGHVGIGRGASTATALQIEDKAAGHGGVKAIVSDGVSFFGGRDGVSTASIFTANTTQAGNTGHYYFTGWAGSDGTNSTTRGTRTFSVATNGDIYAAGISATAGNAITSDPRMKKDWRDGSHSLDDFDNVTTGHFKFIHDDGIEHFGFDASTIPGECKYLTNQIVPEHEDLYYADVEVTEEVPLEDGDDGFGDPDVPQTKTVTNKDRQRNDVPFDDAHKVIGVNVGAMLAKTVAHNQLLKAQLVALEARLAALESK